MANKKRKNGEGTVRLRKDGRWEGRIVVGYADNGNPRTKSVLAKTKTECLEKLEELKEQCGRTSDKLKPDMPFGDWIDFWYQNFSKPKIRLTTQLQLRRANLYAHHPRNRQNTAEQALAERPATILRKAEERRSQTLRRAVRRGLIRQNGTLLPHNLPNRTRKSGC